jgi:hypothetical protein
LIEKNKTKQNKTKQEKKAFQTWFAFSLWEQTNKETNKEMSKFNR